jgi:hypothetical protein
LQPAWIVIEQLIGIETKPFAELKMRNYVERKIEGSRQIRRKEKTTIG